MPEPQKYKKGIFTAAVVGMRSHPVQTKNICNMKDT
jgi:hypothetical protein